MNTPQAHLCLPRIAGVMAFLRPSKHRDLRRGHDSRASMADLTTNDGTARLSRMARRDEKRMIRWERSLQHVPLDVEVARARVTGHFPTQRTRLN